MVDAGACELHLGGQQLWLMPQRAVWWPAQQALLLADVHIGKATSFRRLGVPVPAGTTDDTLQRLDALIARCGAQHLIVLGDLFHSEHVQASGSLDAFAEWRLARDGLRITLIRGNHDHRSGDPSDALKIGCVDAPADLGGLAGLHEPDARFTGPAIAGHVHPAIRLQGRGRDRLRLPCFVLQGQQLTVPAFGAFTGMHTLSDLHGLRVFAVTGEKVFAIPGSIATG